MKTLWKVINMYTCADTYTFIHIHVRTHIHIHIHTHLYIYIFILVEEGEEGGDKTEPCHPPQCLSRIAEAELLHQAQRMIGGIGIVLLSPTCSQTENG